MASWMVHLRIADNLLKTIPGLSAAEFITGNIAPDSGVPNEDWSSYSPSTRVSHFKGAGKTADPKAYAEKYFTPNQQENYTQRQFSFYLGYLIHLLTDVLWVRNVYAPVKDRFPEEFKADPRFIWRVKEDWYDLDFKFLRDHPDFRAFQIYRNAIGFSNDFMDEFSRDAFDNRRAYITEFYLQEKNGLDREYPYLTESEMDAFVEKGTQEILNMLKSY